MWPSIASKRLGYLRTGGKEPAPYHPGRASRERECEGAGDGGQQAHDGEGDAEYLDGSEVALQLLLVAHFGWAALLLALSRPKGAAQDSLIAGGQRHWAGGHLGWKEWSPMEGSRRASAPMRSDRKAHREAQRPHR